MPESGIKRPAKASAPVSSSDRLLLNHKLFKEDGFLIRKDRTIVSRRRDDLPKVVCPIIVEMKMMDDATDLDVVPDVIHKETVPGQKLRLYSMADVDWRPAVGSWQETNDDKTADGEWRRTELREALRGNAAFSAPDSLLCGPFPLSWLVPDPEFRPRQNIIPMYPSSKLMAFFKLWGPITNCDCVVQEDCLTILVAAKYKQKESLVQASLCLHSRFLNYNDDTFPINLQIVNYTDTLEGLAFRIPGQFGAVLKNLTPEQKKLFCNLYNKMEQLERENQQLANDLHNKYTETQKKLRGAAKPKAAVRKQRQAAIEEYHKELLL